MGTKNNTADLVGKVFSRLIVVRRDGVIWGQQAAWECACECGNTARTSSHALTSGDKKSCGCLEKENNASLYRHGKYGTRSHRIWTNMKTRCTNPNNRFYPDYGGRGITVCDKWNEFAGFFDDMGECPEGMTLDRLDNDLGYSKGNCRWATMKQQCSNRRSNINVEIDGVTKTLKEWAQFYDVKYANVYWRYTHGKPMSEWFKPAWETPRRQ